jgi:hypothetical protein
MFISMDSRGKEKLFYSYKLNKAGLLFNPVVAQEITANTRVQLFNAVKDHMKHVIGMQTDSIIVEKDIPLDIGNEIGQWNIENEGEMVMLGSGVYSIHKGERDSHGNPIGQKTRIRGFQKGIDLWKFLTKHIDYGDELPMIVRRNIKLKRIMVRCYENDEERLKDFNLIVDEQRNIKINFDYKRSWERDFENVKDIFKSQILSMPLDIKNVK